MSFDMIKHEIPCPCGEGKITQERGWDDWNRYKETWPIIDCPRCAINFKVVSIKQSPREMEPDTYDYYLVPKDFPNLELKSSYGKIHYSELASSDFSVYLVFSYSKSILKEAYDNIILSSSVSRLTGSAKSISKDKRRYTKTCKIVELKALVQKAILIYDSYVDNWEQRNAEERKFEAIRKEYKARIRKEGTPLDF